jgi:fusion and transport protein UGO1
MTSRDGVNPLRPYYIPPAAGLSSSADSAPPEVASASSSQVFGSSARDLLPDLDYSDYLDSSPSLSDWIRDALDRAVWRYTSILTAQPFDVAKTILQAYVVPDAEEGQWALDGRQRPTPQARESLYDDV